MATRQLVTTNRQRRKPSPSKPRTGAVPTIVNVDPVQAQTSHLVITFDAPVIINGVPPWSALVGANLIAPVSIVAQTLLSITLNYGVAVSTATEVQVPPDDQSALSYQAQRVPAGSYPLA